MMQHGWTYSPGNLEEMHLILLPSIYGRQGSSFPSLIPPDDMVGSELLVELEPVDFSGVIGYHIDNFTCTRSVECFVTQS